MNLFIKYIIIGIAAFGLGYGAANLRNKPAPEVPLRDLEIQLINSAPAIVTSRDLNGDGRDDIEITTQSGNTFYFLRNSDNSFSKLIKR